MTIGKRITAFCLALCMTASLSACSSKDKDKDKDNSGGAKETVSLKVWGPQEDQAVLKEMVDSFKQENTDKNYDIKLAVVGEKDTKTKILEDPAAAADVFSFANDQIRDLVNAGALYEITRNKDKIESENLKSSVEAAKLNDKLYAYPMTADNGYFLYYDSSVVSADQAKKLDDILAAANKANKKVLMDVSDGWYLASFFLGAGCTIGVDENGKQTCNFNNENGVKAGEAIKAFTANKAFMTGDNNILTGGMGDTICAGVSGTWNAEAIQDKLGDHYAATKLPTFTMDGKQVQMGSFAGYKMVGINSQTKQPVEAMKLAEWLTNEKNQLVRFEKRAMGPSNIKASEDERIKKNVALAALAEQQKHASSQRDVLQNFWAAGEAFGTAMESKDYSKTVKQLLDAMVEQTVK